MYAKRLNKIHTRATFLGCLRYVGDEEETPSGNWKQHSMYLSRLDVLVKSYLSLRDHLGTLYSGLPACSTSEVRPD
jgi:hypothetical protein